MNEYESVLREWASTTAGLPLEEIDSVRIVYDEGYYYSSYTFEDPHTDVYVVKTNGDIMRVYGSDIENMGELLNRLLAIANKRDETKAVKGA